MEKKKDDWVKKRNDKVGFIGLLVLEGIVIGLGVVLAGMAIHGIYNVLESDEYLTDDSLPYRDMDNATYTYPATELARLAEGGTWLIFVGVAVLGASLAAALVFIIAVPGLKDEHLLRCHGDGEAKYCPSCGLKLSRLEKK